MNPGITFVGETATLAGDDWRQEAATIEGARYVQLRATFESNLETGEAPAVGAIGSSWAE